MRTVKFDKSRVQDREYKVVVVLGLKIVKFDSSVAHFRSFHSKIPFTNTARALHELLMSSKTSSPCNFISKRQPSVPVKETRHI